MEQTEDQTSGNIKVVCRFRPLNDKEKQIADGVCVNFLPDNKTVQMKSHPDGQESPRFTFDYVFNPSTHQADVYDMSARQIIHSVLQGFNGTVFAYGQTSSGKTFTMSGASIDDPDLKGIIPRMVGDVFSKIESADEHLEFTVKVGYCEIYLEKIKDLLNPVKNNLKIHEDRTRGVFIEGLSEKYASNEDEVYDMMAIGSENREVGFTNMNAGSSRSHSIFIVTITQTNSIDYSAKVGKLYLVDLAGSEKVGKTGAAGKRLEEAKNINKSLTVLGQVINSLTDGKSTHVPYRDSKLTRVLQEALGGNSKTSLIITCSPSPYNEAETLGTLRFGMRAKAIKNKPKVNREYTVAELKLMLFKVKEEVRIKDIRLKHLEQAMNNLGVQIPKELEETKDSNYIEEEDSKNSEYDAVILELEDVRNQLSNEVEMRLRASQELLTKMNELQDLRNHFENLQEKNAKRKEKYKKLKKETVESKEKAEKLEISHNYLKDDFNGLNSKVFILEQKLNEKQVQIDNMKTDQASFKPENQEDYTNMITELRNQLQNSQASNQDLINQINNLQRQMQIPTKSNLGKQPENWEEEKKGLLRDLQNRVDKVISLEMQMDDLKERYVGLERSLPGGIKRFKNKSDALERSLEHITNSYHEIISKNSEMKVEIIMLDKKNNVIIERNNNLETELKRYKSLLIEAEATIKSLYSDLENRKSIRPSFTGTGFSKIVKPIKAGQMTGRMSMAVRTNPFEKGF